MGPYKKITLEEKRAIQLDMLSEFDAFCRNNNIRYSLACGTLIGAIRHKGFIPWDDDVDIILPYPDLIKLKLLYNSNETYICDTNTNKYYEFPFPRLVYKNSFRKAGLVSNVYGVNIDMYYTIELPDNEDTINTFFEDAQRIQRKRGWLADWRARILRYFPLNTIPLFRYYVCKYEKYFEQYTSYSEKGPFFVVGGQPDWRGIYRINFFEKLIDVEFEGRTFFAAANYHEWLTKEYGNYMQLPPVEKRVPYHGGNYYVECK